MKPSLAYGEPEWSVSLGASPFLKEWTIHSKLDLGALNPSQTNMEMSQDFALDPRHH